MTEFLLARETTETYREEGEDEDKATTVALTEAEITEIKKREDDRIGRNGIIDAAFREFNDHLKTNPDAVSEALQKLQNGEAATAQPDIATAIDQVLEATDNGRAIGVGTRSDEAFAYIFNNKAHREIRSEYHKTETEARAADEHERPDLLKQLEALSHQRGILTLGVITTLYAAEKSQELTKAA